MGQRGRWCPAAVQLPLLCSPAAAEVVPCGGGGSGGGARQRWCRRGGARAREEIPATVRPLEEGLGARCRRGRRRRWRTAAAALENGGGAPTLALLFVLVVRGEGRGGATICFFRRVRPGYQWARGLTICFFGASDRAISGLGCLPSATGLADGKPFFSSGACAAWPYFFAVYKLAELTAN